MEQVQQQTERGEMRKVLGDKEKNRTQGSED